MMLALLGRVAQAQDIIIRTNKEELQTKVVEIEDQVVKYKRFDEPDGPAYSIRKDEIFVILYKSGRRETFDAAVTPAPILAPRAAPVPAQPEAAQTSRALLSQVYTRTAVPTTNAAAPSTTEQASSPARVSNQVNREVGRVLVGTVNPGGINETYASGQASGFTLDLTAETRLISNFLNFGVSGGFSYIGITGRSGNSLASAVGDATIVTGSTSVFASGYLPVNRLIGKLEKQDQGFFPYLQFGLSLVRSSFSQSITSTTSNGTSNTYTSQSSDYSFGRYYAIGIDYKFGPKFGLTLQNWSFSGVGIGVNFKI